MEFDGQAFGRVIFIQRPGKLSFKDQESPREKFC